MTGGELLTAGRPSRTLSNCIRRIGLRIVTWAETCADYYATAVTYERLSALSDAELSRRGLSRATLARGKCALRATANFDLSLQGFKRDPEKVEPTFVERCGSLVTGSFRCWSLAFASRVDGGAHEGRTGGHGV